jgi:hypothetical protein
MVNPKIYCKDRISMSIPTTDVLMKFAKSFATRPPNFAGLGIYKTRNIQTTTMHLCNLTISALFLLASTLPLVVSYKITYFSKPNCPVDSIIGEHNEFKPILGCSAKFDGQAKSIYVEKESDSDDGMVLTLFSDESCNPENEIAHGDSIDDDGEDGNCMTIKDGQQLIGVSGDSMSELEI